MEDLSPNLIKYGGKQYLFAVGFVFGPGEKPIALDNNAIEEFEYTSEFNGLFHTGSVTYTDAVGALDKCLERYGVQCQVSFVRQLQETDGQMTVTSFSDVEKLALVFIVDSVQILERSSQYVKYRFGLVSQNAFQCRARLDYSNYPGGEPCLDVVRNCAALAGLEVDQDTFDLVRSPVRLKYLTNGNDDFTTVVKYVLGKMYYGEQKDDSLKFLVYDEIRQQYRVYDMKESKTATGAREVVLSFANSGLEDMAAQDPVELGTVPYFTQTQMVDAFSPMRTFSYDYGSNTFGRAAVGCKQLFDYYSARPDAQGRELDKDFRLDTSGVDTTRRGAYWNNDFDKYNGVAGCLFGNNALLAEVAGDMQCIPGCQVAVKVDRDFDATITEDPDDTDVQAKRYLSYEGIWTASRVHTYVRPPEQKYKQVLTLVRNYANVPPPAPPKAQ